MLLQSKFDEKWSSLMVPKLTEEEHASATDEAATRDLIFIELQVGGLMCLALPPQHRLTAWDWCRARRRRSSARTQRP